MTGVEPLAPDESRPVAIDIRRVIGRKNPGLLRLIPNPVIRYLERIVHVKELNAILEHLAAHRGVDFARAGLDAMGARTVVVNAERIDSARRPIVVANHPLGGLDGLALLTAVADRTGDVLLPANDLLMNLENLAPVLIPLNKHGSNRENRAKYDAAYASEVTVVHFPAGLCSRKKGRTIRDLDWQKSFVVRARRHRRDVVPVHIDGKNSDFFYNLARLRRWSGITFNAEMIYLVDEMFKQRGQTLTLTFGEPIPFETLDSRRTAWEWAAAIKHHVYRLGRDPNDRFVAGGTP